MSKNANFSHDCNRNIFILNSNDARFVLLFVECEHNNNYDKTLVISNSQPMQMFVNKTAIPGRKQSVVIFVYISLSNESLVYSVM